MKTTTPAVFAVGNTYQIMVPAKEPCLFWVKVGDTLYYDEANGIMRSLTEIHRVTVPMEALDRAGRYTVYERPIVERKPYFPVTGQVAEREFTFRPVPKEGIRIYHVSDTHNQSCVPGQTVQAFGPIDLLVLNGDIPDHSGSAENFSTVYEIIAAATGGQIPVVFSRGNHDMRGLCAEKFAEYTPQQNGNTYYTFRLGSLWGIVLDCGEDKNDTSEEYGHMVSCHNFRLRQTEFLKNIIANAENEYAAPGVRHRLVISHIPFTYRQEPPFDIEGEIYTQWAHLLKENVKPHLALHGHLHATFISLPGSKWDTYGQPCPMVIGSRRGIEIAPDGTQHMVDFFGAGIVLNSNNIEVLFSDKDGTVFEKHILP